jgi:putative Holliday junction resolvase
MLKKGRILGIDFGVKRIGLAITDPDQVMAVASGLIAYSGEDELFDLLAKKVRESEVKAFVLGLPLHLSGEESDSSLKVREFAQKLNEAFALPIFFQDERFTTRISAQPVFLEKKKIRMQKDTRDQGAAVLILQSFLACRR